MCPQVIHDWRDLRGDKSPGVYQYQDYGAPRRNVFSTGIPAFLGTMKTAIPTIHHEARPVAHMLSLWSQFELQIGPHHRDCRLAYAVRGFFENGGHWCYVVVLKDHSDAQLAAGLETIGDLNTIDLVCVPDLPSNRERAIGQQQTVLDHCEDMGDRFAILDSQPGEEIAQVAERWSSLTGYNGALYYPWVKVHAFQFSGEQELVPPCGHIAGVINRVDRERGQHKAPANEVLSGVVDLEQQITDREQGVLNPHGVNCIRAFPHRGIRIWGARTLSGQQHWSYVNVRRVFLTAARWLDWKMVEMEFEPNNHHLWSQIERILTEHFAAQYRKGALQGASMNEGFYVKCDAETNPREQRESGIVVAEIGLATAVPFEFIVVRLIRGARGASVSNNVTIQTRG